MQPELSPPILPISWRAALPSLRRALVRFAFVGMTPIVAFYLVYRWIGPIEGMLAGTAVATLALLIQALRIRRLDPVGIVPIGAVLIQGGAGITFQSVDLYLAAPALETSLWGVALIASALVGRPFIPLVVAELQLLPSEHQALPGVQRALRQLTLLWGLLGFVKAATRLLLLSALPLETFLIANTVIVTGWNLLMLGFTMWWVARASRGQIHAVDAGYASA